MRKEKTQEFILRTTQANKTELVVILYDMILEDLTYAKQLFAQSKKADYEKELRHAQKVVNELMAGLNYQYAISYDLLSLYSYMNKQIVAAYMKKDDSYLDSVLDCIEKLHSAFCEISRQDQSGKVMENTQQVYAGLTYGRGTLNESTIGLNDYNRGFKA